MHEKWNEKLMLQGEFFEKHFTNLHYFQRANFIRVNYVLHQIGKENARKY